MLVRMDWLNNGIERMLSGKKPLTPEQWGASDSITARDVDMLRQAAEFHSLRADAGNPDPAFLTRLRNRMLAEAENSERE